MSEQFAEALGMFFEAIGAGVCFGAVVAGVVYVAFAVARRRYRNRHVSPNNRLVHSRIEPLHCCRVPNAAAAFCVQRVDGSLYVSLGEYEQRINYCPFCGKCTEGTLALYEAVE